MVMVEDSPEARRGAALTAWRESHMAAPKREPIWNKAKAEKPTGMIRGIMSSNGKKPAMKKATK
jgi:hypothetical protein